MPKIIVSIYDSAENPYYSGGGPVVIEEIVKRLAPKYEFTIITGNYPGAKDSIKNNITYKHIGLPDRFSSLTSYQFLLPYYAMSEQYDLWLESFTPPYSTALLPLFTKKPVLGLAHILCGEVMKTKYGLPFDFYEKTGLKVYQKIIAPTQQIAKGIQKANPNAQIITIPNGVYHSDFSPLPANENYILFLGRLDWNQKGLDMLIKAYALIKDRIFPQLYIAGHGTTKQINLLKQLIESNNLGDKIILIGKVEKKQKQTLLANALFVAIPSRYEGMSLVALESFAYKKPILCFDIPGFEWTNNNQHVLKAKPFDLHDYAQLMMVLCENKNDREKMGENGYNLVKDLSWEKTAQAYEDCISACLQ